MRSSSFNFLSIAFGLTTLALAYTATVESQSTDAEARSRFDNKTRRERLSHDGVIDRE